MYVCVGDVGSRGDSGAVEAGEVRGKLRVTGGCVCAVLMGRGVSPLNLSLVGFLFFLKQGIE